MALLRRNAPTRAVRSLGYRLRRPVFSGEQPVARGVPDGDGAGLSVATTREERHATAEVRFA